MRQLFYFYHHFINTLVKHIEVMNKKILIGLLLIIIAAFIIVKPYLLSNTALQAKQHIYIPTGSNYMQLLDTLKRNNVLSNYNSFTTLATRMNYNNKVKPGRYLIEPGMSNYQLVKMLRSGKQSIVKLTINKTRLIGDIIRKISKNLEADSMQLTQLLNDDNYLQQWQVNSKNAIALFTPNTYEFYWNTPTNKVIEKIAKAYTQVWTPTRLQQAKQINLSAAQVNTLASIVDEETNKDKEKGNIASVYLNRLKKGMKLQADPTVKYAVGDFTLKRILYKHLEYPSAYNTYQVLGLPPGPICTPSLSSIDAVLKAPSTNYLFFCAKEDFSGYHNFAATDVEHLANAQKFQQAMNARGIK
jgi:UPF0755 protein